MSHKSRVSFSTNFILAGFVAILGVSTVGCGSDDGQDPDPIVAQSVGVNPDTIEKGCIDATTHKYMVLSRDDKRFNQFCGTNGAICINCDVRGDVCDPDTRFCVSPPLQ